MLLVQLAVAARMHAARIMRNRLAIACLLACIAAWIVQSELIQYIQTEKNFNKPYFIIWWCNSLYTLVIPVQLLRRLLCGSSGGLMNTYYLALTPLSDPVASSPSASTSKASLLSQALGTYPHAYVGGNAYRRWSVAHALAERYQRWVAPTVAFLHRAFIVVFEQSPPPASLIGVLALLSTVPNYLWYLALPRTTVSDITAISNCSCVFAYAFAVFMLREPVRARKLGALMLAFTGVIFISVATAMQIREAEEAAAAASALATTSASALLPLGKGPIEQTTSSTGSEILNSATDVASTNRASLIAAGDITTSIINTTTSALVAAALSNVTVGELKSPVNAPLRGIVVGGGGGGPSPSSSDTSSNSSPTSSSSSPFRTRVIGDLMGLFGSALYGLYDTVYVRYTAKKRAQALSKAAGAARAPQAVQSNTGATTLRLSSPTQAQQLAEHINRTLSVAVTALTGMWVLCFMWIPLPILHALNIETFEIPSAEIRSHLFVIGALSCLYNACYILGMSCASQLSFACGLMLALPVTILLDFAKSHTPLHPAAIIGVVCIVGAQFILAAAPRTHGKQSASPSSSAGSPAMERTVLFQATTTDAGAPSTSDLQTPLMTVMTMPAQGSPASTPAYGGEGMTVERRKLGHP